MAKRDLVKISLNLPVPLLNQIDDYAKSAGISRTMAIVLFCAVGLSDIDVKE